MQEATGNGTFGAFLSSSEENSTVENTPSERVDIKNCGEGGQHAHTTVEQPGTRIIVTDDPHMCDSPGGHILCMGPITQ